MKLKKLVLLVGDIILLYASLTLTLIFRYGSGNLKESLGIHLKPFSVIFLVWLLIFYLADLFEFKTFKKRLPLLKSLGYAITLNIVISIILFYLFQGFFELTPKTNLFIFGAIFGLTDLCLRLLLIKSDYAKIKLLILGDSPHIVEIVNCMEANPQIGYEVTLWQKKNPGEKSLPEIKKMVADKKTDIIVIPPHIIKKDPVTVKFIYKLLPFKIDIVNSIDFYETIFQKVPLEEIEETWFLEKITARRKEYDFVKRTIDIVLSLILGIIFFPIIIVIAILTKLSPREGPIFFKHKRTGMNDKPYTHYKFGIMRKDGGEFWTLKDDDRHTALGKFLRYTHLDETPQLWNILKGDLSFIGPRPERVELTKKYQTLPYYDIRHIVKPGLTGWAQINFRPSASLEEALEKLKYDIYYIKNRSIFLDFLITLKTARTFFKNPE